MNRRENQVRYEKNKLRSKKKKETARKKQEMAATIMIYHQTSETFTENNTEQRKHHLGKQRNCARINGKDRKRLLVLLQFRRPSNFDLFI